MKSINIPFHFVLIYFVLLNSGFCDAQELLEKRISIRVINQPVDDVLQKISSLGGFSFSYSPDAIDVSSRVSVNASNQSIREILTALFKGKVNFKERRRHIILHKNLEKVNVAPQDFNLNGYIIDRNTGTGLADASIYESATLASAISNQYGYYKIRLPTAASSLRLEIRKQEYIGRSIAVSNRKDATLPIALLPDTLKAMALNSPTVKTRPDTISPKVRIPEFEASATTSETDITLTPRDYERLRRTYEKVQNKFVNTFATARQAINTRNITDTLHRPFQASVLPFLGTNHSLSGNITNEISVNLIAGYSLGVNMLEVGAILNVVRGNVHGFQLAGIANIVGNDVTGLQYAHMLNLTLGNFKGVQASSLINYSGRNFEGVQLAGTGNVVVGVMNGWQISGGYNYAHTVRKGTQIGMVNYADSSKKTPIGLFSFVRVNGYRRYEFSVNEFNYFNTAFKTGMSRFYNIFTLGFNGFAKNSSLASLGYGFGTAQSLGRGWMLNADLTAQAVFLKGQTIDEIPAGIFRFSAGIEKKLNNHLALFAGPSINLFSGNYSGIINPNGKQFGSVWIGKKPDNNSPHLSWIGFQTGFRFFNTVHNTDRR